MSSDKTPDRSGVCSYRLSLTGPLTWELTGDSSLSPWLDRMAGIMKLQPCIGAQHPRIVFKTGESGAGVTDAPKGAVPDIPSPSVYDCGKHRIIYQPSGDVAIEINDEDNVNMWSAMFPVYRKAIEHGGMALHAGLVELDGKGFLFAAAGGTGKSTCCRRLPEYWKKLSDDMSVVLPDRSGYEAHPFPTWSDCLRDEKSVNAWNVKYAAPLKAVFFLEQAACDDLVPIENRGKTALLLNGSAVQVYDRFWRKLRSEQKRDLVRRLFENACDMAQSVPAYILRVSLSGKFWELIERRASL